MTDLERVRDVISKSKSIFRTEAERELDAHLKEDAERDRALAAAQEAALTRPSREREVIAEMDEELAKLREDMSRMVPEEDLSACENARDKLREELARLREENERYRAAQDGRFEDIVATLRTAEAENARLREDKNDLIELTNDVAAQRDTLLAALREIGEMWTGIDTAAAIARAAVAEVERKP